MANDKKLLVDFEPLDYDKDMIKESAESGSGPVVVEGVLQRANAKNQNGRIYPKDILKREAENYMERNVNQRRALGELDHPDSSVVNLKNVSHNVTDMYWDGNDLKGKIEILTTPSGKILKELLKNNIRVGISSRGLGSVRENHDGSVTVDNDFELIAFDFVSNPSTHGAFMEPINESVDRERVKKANKWATVNKIAQNIIGEVSQEYHPE